MILWRPGIEPNQGIDDYAEYGGPRAVWTFNHNPLRHYLYYLVGYEAEIHMFSLNSFSQPVYLILKPWNSKRINVCFNSSA